MALAFNGLNQCSVEIKNSKYSNHNEEINNK